MAARSLVCGCFCHFRAWQCCRRWRGAVRRTRAAADPAHITSRHGAGGDCLCQGEPAASHDGLHEFDRPRRNEHGDGGGRRACQSPTAAALARRRLREPDTRSRVAAGGLRDPTVSVNDCFRPVSRWWDRITRPEQILESLPQALRVLTDPADCGPVTLALPQDVQTEAYDYPEAFFAPRCWSLRRPPPDAVQLAEPPPH